MPRPGNLDLPQDRLFRTTTADEVPPTPPYRSVPSSSNLHLPPYDMDDSRDQSPARKEKDHGHGHDRKEHVHDHEDTKPARPAVHYPDSLKNAPSYSARPGFVRQDSELSAPPSIAATDEGSSSDYDWSGEEDLVDQEARFEQKHMGVKSKPEGWGVKRVFTFLFSTLIGSAFLAAILIIPAILIHFYWYKRNPTDFRHYVRDNVQAWLFWAAANIVISWGLAMIIDLVPVIVRLFISAAWGHVSEYIKTRIELYNSVKGTVKPAFYAASGWASWSIIFDTIYHLYNTNDPGLSDAQYTIRLAQVVEFFFFFILLWTIQRMLSHLIAFSFHRTAYLDRIENLQEALGAIETLRDYRPKYSPHSRSGTRTPIFGLGLATPFSEKEHFNFLSTALHNATPPASRHGHDGTDADVEDADRTMTGTSGRKGKNRLSWFGTGSTANGSKKHSRQSTGGAAPADEYGRRGGTAVADLMREEIELTHRPATPSQLGPHRYPPTPPQGSPRQSVALDADQRSSSGEGETTFLQAAKAIKNVVLHDARGIGPKDEDQAGLSWNVSSSHEAKRLARLIYMRFKDRRRNYLIPSDFHPAFRDHDSAQKAFRVFDKDNNGDISRAEIKTTLLKVYKERRFLSRSMRDVGAALKTLDRILLLFAMIVVFFISLSVFGVSVGDSLTSVYSILIAASFIFKNAASNAFDAIMFLFVSHPYDTGDRVFIDDENYIVKKVGLFATLFSRSDGTETYYFNSQLFTKFITNVRRSGKTAENLTMQVAWRTPLEKLDQLEKYLNDWLSTEENRWFEPSTSITLQHIVYQRYLEITIGIGHNSNWQDWGMRQTRKTAFHAAVQYYCRQLGIIGYEAPLPIVYGDPTTQKYNPPASPYLDAQVSPSMRPSSPIMSEQQMREEEEEAERVAKKMTPSLGFLPPLAVRSSNLSKARRSKSSRKAMLRAVDG